MTAKPDLDESWLLKVAFGKLLGIEPEANAKVGERGPELNKKWINLYLCRKVKSVRKRKSYAEDESDHIESYPIAIVLLHSIARSHLHEQVSDHEESHHDHDLIPLPHVVMEADIDSR